MKLVNFVPKKKVSTYFRVKDILIEKRERLICLFLFRKIRIYPGLSLYDNTHTFCRPRSAVGHVGLITFRTERDRIAKLGIFGILVQFARFFVKAKSV